MTPLSFGISIETVDLTGDVVSVYIQVRRGKSHVTHEFADGAALADYNRSGELLGIELLGPCKVSVVDQLAANETADLRKRTKEFIRNTCPRKLIAA